MATTNTQLNVNPIDWNEIVAGTHPEQGLSTVLAGGITFWYRNYPAYGTVQLIGDGATQLQNLAPVIPDAVKKPVVKTDGNMMAMDAAGDGVDSGKVAVNVIERTTETVDSTPATVTAQGRDHTVLCDTTTAGSVIDLTVDDAAAAGDLLNIVNTGTFGVNVTGTGLSETISAGEARSYIWTGAEWITVSGGAGGGGGAGVGIGSAIWKGTPGAEPNELAADGGLHDPAAWPGLFARFGTKYGGDGITTFGVPDLQGIGVTGAGSQTGPSGQVWDDSDADATGLIEDQFQGHYHQHTVAASNTGNGAAAGSGPSGPGTGTVLGPSDDGVNGTPRTGEYTRAASLAGYWYIVASDAVQEIPADPALIKDWVEKYNDPSNTGPVLNAWGDGRYEVETLSNLGATATNIINTNADATTDNQGQQIDANASQYAYAQYNRTTNSFEAVTSSGVTYNVIRISRWEDVAGADAQLNPPVDGYENVWTGSAAKVTNIWGTGQFRVRYYDGVATWLTGYLDVTDLSQDTVAATGAASPTFDITYLSADQSFNTGTGTVFILSIDKFNSLVNVLHTYHPNPRSVAQKDWVEKFNDYTNTAATITNVWGDGLFKVVIRDSTDANTVSSEVYVRDGVVSIRNEGSDSGSTVRVRYDMGGTFQVFASAGTWYIAEILKWEDSQANDAPREVLDDGWELVYDDESNTSGTVASSQIDGGITTGYYRFEMLDSPNRFTNVLSLSTLSFDAFGQDFSAGGSRVKYTTATNLFTLSSSATQFPIVKIWRFTGLLRISANYNLTSLSDGPNQVKALNTDAGDVDAGLPTSPNLGDLFEVWNTGTNGNHVTGLPNSITIGDGKGIRFRYVDGWKYEDVIIEETDLGGGLSVKKWAGGRAIVQDAWLNNNAARDISAAGLVSVSSLRVSCENTVGGLVVNVVPGSLSATSYQVNTFISTSGLNNNGDVFVEIEGRWKTGV